MGYTLSTESNYRRNPVTDNQQLLTFPEFNVGIQCAIFVHFVVKAIYVWPSSCNTEKSKMMK